MALDTCGSTLHGRCLVHFTTFTGEGKTIFNATMIFLFIPSNFRA
jgi:hypothetical protein